MDISVVTKGSIRQMGYYETVSWRGTLSSDVFTKMNYACTIFGIEKKKKKLWTLSWDKVTQPILVSQILRGLLMNWWPTDFSLILGQVPCHLSGS